MANKISQNPVWFLHEKQNKKPKNKKPQTKNKERKLNTKESEDDN